MREVYVWNGTAVVPKGEAQAVTGHHIIRDTMDAMWHPSDGKHYDSKSKFRAVTKAHGCIEVGNEVQRQRPAMDTNIKRDVVEAYRKVRDGYKPNLGRE